MSRYFKISIWFALEIVVCICSFLHISLQHPDSIIRFVFNFVCNLTLKFKTSLNIEKGCLSKENGGSYNIKRLCVYFPTSRFSAFNEFFWFFVRYKTSSVKYKNQTGLASFLLLLEFSRFVRSDHSLSKSDVRNTDFGLKLRALFHNVDLTQQAYLYREIYISNYLCFKRKIDLFHSVQN